MSKHTPNSTQTKIGARTKMCTRSKLNKSLKMREGTTRKTWLVFLLLLALSTAITACGISDAARVEKDVYINVEAGQPLILNFPGCRIHVETWDNDQVKISPIIVKNPVVFTIDGNVIQFDLAKHLATYPADIDKKIEQYPATREVHFYIYVPRNTPLQIYADGVNAKEGCVISYIKSRMAAVRECILTDGFYGQGDILTLRETAIPTNNTLNYNQIIEQEKPRKHHYWWE